MAHKGLLMCGFAAVALYVVGDIVSGSPISQPGHTASKINGSAS
jgi:hypothetical protein